LGGDGRGLEAAGQSIDPPDPDYGDIWTAAESIKARIEEINPNDPLLKRVIRRPADLEALDTTGEVPPAPVNLPGKKAAR
jgi:hypothetical protein